MGIMVMIDRILVMVAIALLATAEASAAGDPSGADPALCDRLATIPNPPMSVEACRSMMRMGADFDAGSRDRAGHRNGDERMGCRQILAELGTMDGAGLSDRTLAANDASLRDVLEQERRHAAETQAVSAAAVPAYAAAMAADTAVTVASGGMAAGMATTAVAAAVSAKSNALAAKQQEEKAPVRDRFDGSLAAGTSELGASMRSNPRFARLLELAREQDCRLPPELEAAIEREDDEEDDGGGGAPTFLAPPTLGGPRPPAR